MKFLQILGLYTVCFMKAIAQDCYCLVQNSDYPNIITDSHGQTKKTIQIQDTGTFNKNFFALNGGGNRIYCAGNIYDDSTETGQASLWTLDLKGDVLSQQYIGKKPKKLSSVSSIAIFHQSLVMVGVVRDLARVEYGLMLVTDFKGNTLFEFSLLDVPKPVPSSFEAVAATNDQIFVVGRNNGNACLWIFDHHYQLIREIA